MIATTFVSRDGRRRRQACLTSVYSSESNVFARLNITVEVERSSELLGDRAQITMVDEPPEHLFFMFTLA